MNKNNELMAIIGYEFKDENLLSTAMTHVSYANEFHKDSYERLEFLGDTVIEIVVSEYIYRNSNLMAGLSTKLRSWLVSTHNLSEISAKLGLERFVLTSRALSRLGQKNLADIFESVVGAVYLDGGLEKAREVIERFVIIDEKNIEYALNNCVDAKTKLQEVMQAQNKKFEYIIANSYGLDHEKIFEVQLVVEGEVVTQGKERSIQMAEELCAKQYLDNIN